MSTATATTESVRHAHGNVETRTAGSGNFHYLTNKAFKRLRKGGDTLSKGFVDRTLKSLDKSGRLARLGMEAEGWSRSEDPTAWDALLNLLKAQAKLAA